MKAAKVSFISELNSSISIEDSDYYGSESEKAIESKVKPELKIGRLSTVKERLSFSNQIVGKFQTRKSAEERKYLFIIFRT